MTAVAYAMSDVVSVRVPESAGGCGEQHEVQADDDGRKYVACDHCAPYLTGSHASFSGTAEGVPSTPDEIAHREYVKQQAETSNAALDSEIRRNYALAKIEEAQARAAEKAKAARENPAEFVSGLSAKEKKELAAMLAGELGGDEPAKRPPGRPRGSTSSK